MRTGEKNVYKYFYNLELTKTSYFWHQDTIQAAEKGRGVYRPSSPTAWAHILTNKSDQGELPSQNFSTLVSSCANWE